MTNSKAQEIMDYIENCSQADLDKAHQAIFHNTVQVIADINSTIFAQGAPLGTPEYFRIRELCTSVLYEDKANDPCTNSKC